jgi:hypothetical protein
MIFATRPYGKVRTASAMMALVASLYLMAPVSASAQSAFDDPGMRANNTNKAGGIADLVPVNPSIDAGSISIGATAQVVVTFRNDSGRALTTGAINLYPSSTVSAAVTLNECSNEPLAAGATCAIGLSIQGLQAGRWRVEMLMRHSGVTRLVTATLQGNVETSTDTDKSIFKSDIEAIPAILDFKKLTTSQPAVLPVVLRNITSKPVDIQSIYIEAAEQAGFTFRTDCSKLGPGQACIVTVIWSPILRGQATGVLVVEHSGPTTVASVPLLGEFTPDDAAVAKTFPQAVPGKGLLVASQEKIDFGQGIDTASSVTVSLVNVGDAPVTIKSVGLAGGDSGLSLAQSGCKMKTVLEPVEACPLTISWTPVRAGAVIDDVQVVHDGARGVLVLPVRGTATGIVSKDNKAIRLADVQLVGSERTASTSGDRGLNDQIMVQDKNIDPGTVLDGFVVTSHSAKRSIITGPGGSRIVRDGEQVVIGGFPWMVVIRASGVEFRNGDAKVLLLFDRALSSQAGTKNANGTTSAGTSSTASTTPLAPVAAPIVSAAPTPVAASIPSISK